MARIRVFIVLALAVAAGGTFAYGTYQYMQNVPKPAAGAARRFRRVPCLSPRAISRSARS